MDGRAAVADKAETFLRGLTPRARGMLIRRLEENSAGINETEARRRLILEAARAIAESRASAKRAKVDAPDMGRLVFAAFDPYLIEERLAFPERGFVSSATLSNLWAIVSTELLPVELGPWNDPATRPVMDSAEAYQEAAAKIEAQLFDALARHVERVEDEPKAQQRFMSRVGGEVAYREVLDMIAIRDRLDDLPTLSAAVVHLLGSGPVDLQLMEQVGTYLTTFPESAGWVAAGVHKRLSAVTPLLSFARMLAGADGVRQVRATPAAAAFVDLGFAVADRAASRFQAICRSTRNANEAAAQIVAFRTVLNELSNGLDIDGDGTWKQRMVAVKRRFSDILYAEFDKLLPAMRRAFRLQDGVTPGPADGAEAVFLAAIFSAASKARDTLAINGLIGRMAPLIDQAVEIYAQDLPARLRKAIGDDKLAVISATDYLIKTAAHLFGDDYAAHLKRSREQQLKAGPAAA